MHVQTLLTTGFQQSVFGLRITHGIPRNRLLRFWIPLPLASIPCLDLTLKKKSSSCLFLIFIDFLNPQRNRTDIYFDEETEGGYIDLRKNSA